MLPKENRLPSPLIKTVMRRGKRIATDGLQFIFIQNTIPISRFAFIVPKSVDKRAVVRNRIRRVVREAVRLALPAIAPGWDGVFLIRKGLPKAQELLRRAGLLP